MKILLVVGRQENRPREGQFLLADLQYIQGKAADTIADSSAKSEFIGMTYACKHTKNSQQFLDELGIILGDIPILHVDNTSAMTMVISNKKSRVKHLGRKILGKRFHTNPKCSCKIHWENEKARSHFY